MKRGEPLKRTVPLKQTSGLRRTSSMQQKAGRESLSARGTTSKSAPRRVQRDVGPTPEVVDACLERDHFSCVLCGMGIGPEGRGVGWALHHRLLRSQGPRHTPDNLITVCQLGASQCHDWIHGNPADARKGGWMLSGRQEPLAIPVLIAGQRWVYLTSTGLYADVKEQAS
jgi:hypothetical protein